MEKWEKELEKIKQRIRDESPYKTSKISGVNKDSVNRFCLGTQKVRSDMLLKIICALGGRVVFPGEHIPSNQKAPISESSQKITEKVKEKINDAGYYQIGDNPSFAEVIQACTDLQIKHDELIKSALFEFYQDAHLNINSSQDRCMVAESKKTYKFDRESGKTKAG